MHLSAKHREAWPSFTVTSNYRVQDPVTRRCFLQILDPSSGLLGEMGQNPYLVVSTASLPFYICSQVTSSLCILCDVAAMLLYFIG